MKPSHRPTDSALVIAYQKGDTQALVLLVKRWHKKFCLKAFYIVKNEDEAKDIAQDSWRTIMNKIDSLNNPERFSGWAMRIVSMKAIDVLRKKSKERLKKSELKKETGTTDESYDEKTELKRALNKAVLTLPIEQQQVIKLFYVQSYTLRQIADILHIKTGTVKSRLFHAREKLKETLKTYNYEN